MSEKESALGFSASREQWNERYAAGEHVAEAHDPLLAHLYGEFIGPLFPEGGRGLDLAGGAGRHGIWMARQMPGASSGLLPQPPTLPAKSAERMGHPELESGWRMTVADLSDAATAIARRNADAAGVSIETVSEPGMETLLRAGASREQQYDLIMVFQFLDRSLFPAIRDAVRPGGLVLYKAHTIDHLEVGDGKGPKAPEHLLERQELLRVFTGWRVLYYNETVTRRGTQCILAQCSAHGER